ncbi:unnamed protein product [Peronospora belbahrii]|uniref:RRM domain-containing protein n=1 Tax=Peronospora belbahrii TaxID=622444 RepID=A0ABN8CTP2_9STRA|nr:unnamed protein product [Peronospora belbahrii]
MVSPRFSVSRSPSPRRSSSAENVRKSSISRSHSTSPSRSTSNTQDVPPDKNKTSSIQPITLRVENLTRNVNADHLREIFGKFGLVIRVEMTIPRGKASAMVIFASQQDADNAKDHMHDGWLDGNKLRVLLDTCQSETDQRVTNTTRRTLSPVVEIDRQFVEDVDDVDRHLFEDVVEVLMQIVVEDDLVHRCFDDVHRHRFEVDDVVH